MLKRKGGGGLLPMLSSHTEREREEKRACRAELGRSEMRGGRTSRHCRWEIVTAADWE
jgi:hypothetical protein